jgi:hypothetical protein
VELNAPISIVGAICVVAAVVGGGLKGAGFEFPALTSKSARILLATVGAVFVAAGVVLPTVGDQGNDGPPNTAPTETPKSLPSYPSRENPTPTPLQPPTDTPSSSVDASVTRQGTFTLNSGYGVLLHTELPNWGVKQGCGDCELWFQGDLHGGYGGDVALLPPDTPPDYNACLSATQYQRSIDGTDLKSGIRGCVRSRTGELSFIEISEVGRDSRGKATSLTIATTVWT